MRSDTLRVIFIGTPEFAVPVLDALIARQENIVCVITQPDRPKGRGRKLSPSPVKERAVRAQIPVLQPTRIRTEEFLQELQGYQPDIMVVAAYGRILPGPLLHLPPLGTINVHGSLLPKYRGAAPMQWAIINGERETGITIMQMDEGLDTGDMLLKGTVAINDDDTAATVAEKMAALGGELISRTFDFLYRDGLVPEKQDASLATLAPPLEKDLGKIDWHKSAFQISCLIRGLDPWPKAYASLNSRPIKFFSPRVVEGSCDQPPGTICRADKDGLLISCGRDYLLVREIQREGGNRMAIEPFLRGFPLSVGAHFE